MQIEVEIKATQIFEDKTDTETNICEGEINYYDKGTILEFIEKHEEQQLEFKMTILENKIITDRNNQRMIFDLENKNHTQLNTPYGALEMDITTKKIEIKNNNKDIEEINLEYEIKLENKIKYMNKVEIKVKSIEK